MTADGGGGFVSGLSASDRLAYAPADADRRWRARVAARAWAMRGGCCHDCGFHRRRADRGSLYGLARALRRQ